MSHAAVPGLRGSSPAHAVLLEAVAAMPVVNHHEHAWTSFCAEYGLVYDLPYFLCNSILRTDLAAAGYCQQEDQFAYLGDPYRPAGMETAWRSLRPFLERVRNTSYCRSLLRAIRDLFGATESDVFSDRWREVSERMLHRSLEYRGKGSALCSRMRVAATVLDAKLAPVELARVRPPDHRVLHVVRLDRFIHEERGLAATLREHPGADPGQWLAHFDEAFRDALAAGAVGFKSGLAYNRRIEYADPSLDDVAPIFKRGILEASPAEKTTYQDFMMNRLCRLCAEADVPLQIHTGLQAGTEQILEDSRPTLLASLLRRHGALRVDLFHGGYPWVMHAGLMAKLFPNVYIDGCWLPQISPSAYRAALTSWIETVPANKIFAWGGDSTLLEQSYATLLLTKDLVVDVLGDLVDRRYFGLDYALQLAGRILHDNGFDFWRLPGRSGERP